MSDIGFAMTLRNARLQQIVAAFDAAATPGSILLYTVGSGRPQTGGAITDQVLLGTVGLSQPCGTITSAVLTFNAFVDDLIADDTGLISWARGVDGNGTFVTDMGCSALGDPSPKTLVFNTLSVQAGGVIQIVSGTFTEGNA
jgi:hypothetical protein